MKLRRAMAVAAATAVMAPAAFLAATPAFATDGDNVTPQTSSEAPAPGAGENAEAGQPPAEPSSSTTDEAPAPTESAPMQPEDPDAGAPEAGKPSTSTSPGASTSPSASPGTSEPAEPSATATTASPGPVQCSEDGEVTFDKNLRTRLTGLPERIVAGSGFHAFELNVSNKGGNTYKRVDLGVFVGQIDENTWEEDSRHLTLQYKDPETGAWTGISLDDDDEGSGYLGYTDIRAKETFSVELRLSVDKSAPSGLGYAIGIGLYADDKGNCVIADDYGVYEFDIVTAGSDAGEPGEAKPQTGGKKPIPAKPAGNTEIKPVGHLAETGSSSMVPVIGMAGGIAVVAGAGVMFAMKRRRGGDAAA
ncbi:LAETG motif-containing sortase-dependent surface protein [Streptomyces sp. NPDC059134]|uniref:LAETG motif-containing sortase-dependent surface protein n=1 Tax=Streptomyces sp. NPDC059134 TaxID=3346738 RepID=UPI0036B613DF